MRAPTRSLLPVVVAAALALPLTGCSAPERETSVSEPSAEPSPPSAGPTGSAGAPPADRPSRSPLVPPTMGPPTAPPKLPTDLRRATALAGRITRGGDGPCYGLTTDDGREYALYGEGVGTLVTGTSVRVTIGPPDPAVECGPGIPATIVKISPVG